MYVSQFEIFTITFQVQHSRLQGSVRNWKDFFPSRHFPGYSVRLLICVLAAWRSILSCSGRRIGRNERPCLIASSLTPLQNGTSIDLQAWRLYESEIGLTVRYPHRQTIDDTENKIVNSQTDANWKHSNLAYSCWDDKLTQDCIYYYTTYLMNPRTLFGPMFAIGNSSIQRKPLAFRRAKLKTLNSHITSPWERALYQLKAT